MQAIERACEAERWEARVAAVISNRVDAEGLRYARDRGIPVSVVDHRGHASRDVFDAALAAEIDQHAPDVLVLAGFMRILGPAFVRRYAGRMLNVHPSLLPAFTGLHTHRRALDAGCKLVGATVHFVTADLDHGPIVAQAAVPVLPDDTETSLSQRVLAAEHVMYPRAVRWFLQGQLQVKEGRVRQLQGEPQALL